MKGNDMVMRRKLFYVTDIMMLVVFMLMIEHTTTFDSSWIALLLDYALLLRLNITILLWHRERLAIFPTWLFMALFAIVIFSLPLGNMIFRTDPFPEFVSYSLPGMTDGFKVHHNIFLETVFRLAIFWTGLAPFCIASLQFLQKKTKFNGYHWYDLLGVALFKDRIGRYIVTIMLLVFAALLIGYEMQESLSFYSLMALPLAAYYVINKNMGRNADWKEYMVLAIGLVILDHAQFESGTWKILCLTLSALTILSVCVYLGIRSKKALEPIVAFILVGFVLPDLSIGYNIYKGTTYARGENYIASDRYKGFMYITKKETKDGKETIKVGLRDRYHIVIPCKYRTITADNVYEPIVNCRTEYGENYSYDIETGEPVFQNQNWLSK